VKRLWLVPLVGVVAAAWLIWNLPLSATSVQCSAMCGLVVAGAVAAGLRWVRSGS
jgi:hypothetical protein